MPQTSELVSRAGRAFTLHDWTFIDQQLLDAQPLDLLREAVDNARDAILGVDRDGDPQRRGRIDIFPSSEGFVCIADNGCGMTAQTMERSFQGAGSSTKRLGGTGRMGIGMKAYMRKFSPEGVVYLSLRDSECHQMEIGQNRNGFGLIEYSGGAATKRVGVPPELRDLQKDENGRDNGCRSGTMVILKGIKFNYREITRFLNTWLWEPDVPIRVWRPSGEELLANDVIGLKRCLQGICDEENFGVVDLPHATVYWGISFSQQRMPAGAINRFDPMRVYYMWNGSVYRSVHESDGGFSALGRWGIQFGGKRIFLVINAKDGPNTPPDKGIVPDISRKDIKGWKVDKAAAEFREQLPVRLRQFMESLAVRQVVPNEYHELVRETLDMILESTGAVPGAGGLRAGKPTPNGTARGGGGGGGGHGGGGRRGAHQALGRKYTSLWVTSEGTNGARAVLIGQTLHLNFESPTYQRLFKMVGGPITDPGRVTENQHREMAAIAAEALCGLIRMEIKKKRPLTDEEIDDATDHQTFAGYYAREIGKRMNLPRLKGKRRKQKSKA